MPTCSLDQLGLLRGAPNELQNTPTELKPQNTLQVLGKSPSHQPKTQDTLKAQSPKYLKPGVEALTDGTAPPPDANRPNQKRDSLTLTALLHTQLQLD